MAFLRRTRSSTAEQGMWVWIKIHYPLVLQRLVKFLYLTKFDIIWQSNHLGIGTWNHTQSQLLGSCRLIVLLLRLHQISVCFAQSSTTVSTGPIESVPIFFYLPHGRQIARRQSGSSRAVNGLAVWVMFQHTLAKVSNGQLVLQTCDMCPWLPNLGILGWL